MEYQILTPSNQEYPKRLLERLGNSSPEQIFYRGPLDFLKRFSMAVISADSISGLAMMAANQLLFTIREYDLNFIGGWHSVMETEIFRLGLFRKNLAVTLFTAKGLTRALSDVVFVPFAEKGTKTLALAKRVFESQISIFTTDHEDNKSLHQLGIPGLSRKSVGNYLENFGAHRARPFEKEQHQIVLHEPTTEPENKSPKFIQGKFT